MRLRFLLGMLVVGLLGPLAAVGQPFALDIRQQPLAEALAVFRTKAGADVVFAQRLVAGKISTCRYQGQQPKKALTCLLKGSGLTARTVRPNQFVLVKKAAAQAPSSRPQRVTIAGTVINRKTRERLPGAHIFIPGLKRGTTTNTAGYFALSVFSTDTLQVKISYLGFQSRTLTLPTDRQVEVTVGLEPIVLEGQEVLVKETMVEGRQLNTVPGLITVPVKELSAMPAFLGESDLFQSLQWAPGVRQSAEVGGALTVRGGNEDQNLYLLDGVPVYHPWHTFNLFSIFQDEALKDVRLYKGAFPARYGGRLSAVLDTQMKDGRRDHPSVTAALSPISIRSVVEAPVSQNASVMLAGRRSYLDLIFGRDRPIRTLDGGSDTLRLGYYFYDTNAKITLRPGVGHQLSLSLYRGRDKLDLRLPFQSLLEEQRSNLGLTLNHWWGNQFYSLRYRYLHSPLWFATLTLYQSDYRAQEQAEARPTELATIASDYRVRIGDTGLKFRADYFRSLAHQIELGGQLIYHRFNSLLDARVALSEGAADSLSEQSHTQALEAVVYMQDTWQPTARWRIQPGIRFSGFSSGSHIYATPRLHLRYALNPKWFVLRGGLSTQVQYMHQLRDRYSFAYDVTSSRWIPAGPEVEPARGYQVSAGLESHPLPRWVVSIDGYWRHFRHVLVPRDVYRSKDGLGGPGIKVGAILQQYTPAFQRAYGIDLFSRYRYGAWRFWLSYSASRVFQRSRQAGDINYTPSPYDVPHVLNGALRWANDHWHAVLAGELRSGYPTTVPTARYSMRAPADTKPTVYLYRPEVYNGRLPPYARLDMTVGYHFEWAALDWQVQLQVYNLTYHKNVIERQYHPGEEAVRQTDQHGLPILPMLDLKAKW